jgi:hypothetical protein
MSGARESFLRDAFARLNAESLEYCVSRNADKVFRSTSSDVDLIVAPGSAEMVEKVFTESARSHGYRLIARTEFTNLCLVFWAPGGDFVRIDLDGEIRWRIFEIAGARSLLTDCRIHDGMKVASARAELLVMVDRLAWRGSLPQHYRNKVEDLLKPNDAPLGFKPDPLIAFLSRDDAPGLRRHLCTTTISAPRLWIQAAKYAWRDLSRAMRRIFTPPGLFIESETDLDNSRWDEVFEIMSMAFPHAKSSLLGTSALPGMLSLFRGGIVVVRNSGTAAARICKRFSSPQRRFRIVRAQGKNEFSGNDLPFPADALDPAVQVADRIGNLLAATQPLP